MQQSIWNEEIEKHSIILSKQGFCKVAMLHGRNSSTVDNKILSFPEDSKSIVPAMWDSSYTKS